MVDGATSEYIPIVSGVPLGSVLGPPLVKCLSWLRTDYAYADDSTLLAVDRMTVDRSAVAASLNRDLARIQEWRNHWWMIQNPNKIKASVVSGSRTVNHPLVTSLVWGFLSELVPTLTSLV